MLQWLQELLLALLSKSMSERALLDASSSSQVPTPRAPAVAQLPQHLVRTDSSVNTMTSYLSRANSDLPPSASPLPIVPTKKRCVFRPPLLASLEQLLNRMEREAESGWEKRLAEHVYVGKLDNMRVLLQFGTALSMVNAGALSEEYFYQIALRNFGYHCSLKITPTAPSVAKLLLLGLQTRGTAKEKRDGIVMEAMSVLMHWREMLSDYFAITIDTEGNLASLPLLLENWVPDWLGLPNFFLQLAVSDFTEEARAFDSIAVHLAHLYRYTARQPGDYVPLVLLPAVRDGVWLPKRFFDEGGVVQLTSVEQLYKVFERC